MIRKKAAPDDQALEDAQTLARVRGALEGYLAAGGGGAAVNVGHVLDLLNPRGLWRHDPERKKPVKPGDYADQPPEDYGGDPMTGCLPMPPGA